ncbi:hypothetical protein CHS0354_030793 [Potamilus streckersoni]|uniref:Cyclic nucleotide-binding domain-containing protein n=1 Tax=Potamilus streckersoni TaxID=2493646 RepID=A0AAE0WAQ1_9BIVA|nr:hypothetical protein CHS0354_030793 [Potamilus streckersoni]
MDATNKIDATETMSVVSLGDIRSKRVLSGSSMRTEPGDRARSKRASSGTTVDDHQKENIYYRNAIEFPIDAHTDKNEIDRLNEDNTKNITDNNDLVTSKEPYTLKSHENDIHLPKIQEEDVNRSKSVDNKAQRPKLDEEKLGRPKSDEKKDDQPKTDNAITTSGKKEISEMETELEMTNSMKSGKEDQNFIKEDDQLKTTHKPILKSISSGMVTQIWQRTITSELKMRSQRSKESIQLRKTPQASARGHTSSQSNVPLLPQISMSQKKRTLYAINLHQELSRKARQEWKKVISTILFCKRCYKMGCFGYSDRKEFAIFMKTLSNFEYVDDIPDLLFDPTDYRADKETKITEETKRILVLTPKNRSSKEKYTALIALQNIKTFAEYPIRMQTKVVEVAYYEAYEAKRVITREGHPATAYYLILSGTVVAMVLDKDRKNVQSVTEFSKGDAFEDWPIIEEKPRQFTAVAKTACELLCIGLKEYRRIFMSGGVKNLDDPDQEKFLKQQSFLKGWPIQILQEHPKKCKFLYFKRGELLTHDTQYWEWLILVKSGSLRILKQLQKVDPHDGKKKKEHQKLTEKEKRERKEERRLFRRLFRSELQIPLKSRQELDEIAERPDGRPQPFVHPEVKQPIVSNQKGRLKNLLPSPFRFKNTSEGQQKRDYFASINQQLLYTIKGDSNDSENQPNAIRHGSFSVRSQTQRSTPVVRFSSFDTDDEYSRTPSVVGTYALWVKRYRPYTLDTDDEYSRTPSVVGNQHGRMSVETDISQRHDSLSTSEKPLKLRSIMDELNSNITSKDPLEVTEADLNPQFVEVQILTKGQLWGMADLILGEQPSFSVVSSGADCILINKQLYMEHASESLIRKMRQELCPYPTDEELQEGLQVSVDWKAYRKSELSSTMKSLSVRKDMRTTATGKKSQESY